MKKKILIGVGIFVLFLAIATIYLNNRNRTLSPPGETNYDNNGLSINIKYSRPSVKGRLIFGNEQEGALLPYGVYWRLGANEPTAITVNKDFLFNGQRIVGGTYRMYAVPGSEEFEITLNSEISFWGYSEPDYFFDVVKVRIPTEKGGDHVEQFTIRVEEEGKDLLIVCEWADVKVKIPIEPA